MSVQLDLDCARLMIVGCVLTPATGAADEVKILLVRFVFVNAQTFAVLPGIAPLASHAVCPIVHLAVSPADTIENPVVLLLLELLESLLVPFDLGEPASL
jgi:hypothetical protein